MLEFNNIYSRNSSPPPSSHRLQCSGSQESFAVDHHQFCGASGGGGGGLGHGGAHHNSLGDIVIAASQWSLGPANGHSGGCPGLTMGSAGMSCPHGHPQLVQGGGVVAASYPPPPPPQAMMMGNGGGMVYSGLGPSQSSSFHGPPLPQCNPCPTATNANNFNSVPLPGPSRWGPRSSCPVHSPFRARLPNGGSICSGHQVSGSLCFSRAILGTW